MSQSHSLDQGFSFQTSRFGVSQLQHTCTQHDMFKSCFWIVGANLQYRLWMCWDNIYTEPRRHGSPCKHLNLTTGPGTQVWRAEWVCSGSMKTWWETELHWLLLLCEDLMFCEVTFFIAVTNLARLSQVKMSTCRHNEQWKHSWKHSITWFFVID